MVSPFYQKRAMTQLIAIVGRPNVGKSTLFNRLSRSRDALVDNHPGITRDRLYTSISHEGVPLTLMDTGGFDEAGNDPLLDKVRDQVEKAIEEADMVIFMVDGREGVLPADQEIATILRRSKKKTFLAVNKIDGSEHDHLALDFYSLGTESVHPISAAHGYGLRPFMDQVVKGLTKSQTEKDTGTRIRVAVLGRPNVGKSSMINQILGTDRMLVSELPGTTRDSVDTLFTWRKKEYLLVDTAGIRRKARVKEKIEKFSMVKALKSLERCHVATILLDASEGVLEQDARICGYAFEQGKGIVLAVNKWDLIKSSAQKKDSIDNSIERQLRFISHAPRVNVSALTGERVMKLFEKIDLVYEQCSRTFSTPAVNRVFKEIFEEHQPPRFGRERLKLFYATQTSTRPPTFLLFVNRPDVIHFSYERFMINRLRVHFQLENAPIRLLFRKK
jgi:GTP-binding protein